MKILILISTLILSLAAQANLPSDWFQESFEKGESTTLTMPDSTAGAQIDKIFETQHKTLKRLNKNTNKKWKVTDYVFMLALSKSGLVGFKSLSGKSVFQVYYTKNKNKSVEVTNAEPIDLYIHEDMTDLDLADQVNPVVDALVNSDKIDRNPELNNQIIDKINSVKKVVGNLEGSTNRKFFLSSFRIDLGINRSGMLIPGWMAQKGTEVVLRLQWTRIKKKGQAPVAQKKNNLSSNFQKFTESILKDLDKVDESPLAGTGKKAVKFRIGMGVTTTQTIVISQASTTFMGNLIFKRNPKYKPAKSFESNDYTYSIDKGLMNKDITNNLGSVPASKFIKGLNKAVKMGSYFVRKADTSKKWNVSLLRAWYIINMKGFLGLAPITGTSEIEVFYK